jgi:hypothetical protein
VMSRITVRARLAAMPDRRVSSICCARLGSIFPIIGMTMTTSVIGISGVDSSARMSAWAWITSSFKRRRSASARLITVMSSYMPRTANTASESSCSGTLDVRIQPSVPSS